MRRLLIFLSAALLWATTATAQFSPDPGGRAHQSRPRETYAVLLDTRVITTGQAGVVFGPSVISSLYDEYQIELVNVVPTTNGGLMCIQLSKDGGNTWEATNYKYALLAYDSANFGRYVFSNSTSCMVFHDAISNNASYGLNASSWLTRQVGKVATLRSEVIFLASDNNLYGGFGRSWWQDASTWNAFQVISSGSTMASGTVRLYGISKQ